MKALLLKDAYVMWKQMRFYLFFILVFSVIPNDFLNIYGVVYVSMIPYNAMACDERCKWDQLAAMMPYSVRDIVLSKYILGWVSVAGAAVLSGLLRGILSLALDGRLFPLSGLLLSVSGAVGILSVALPLMFRFGVEKGRMVMLAFLALIFGTIAALSLIIQSSGPDWGLQTVLLPAAALALTAVSVPLSIRIFRARR